MSAAFSAYLRILLTLRCDPSSGEYEQTFRMNIMPAYLWQENNLHHQRGFRRDWTTKISPKVCLQ